MVQCDEIASSMLILTRAVATEKFEQGLSNKDMVQCDTGARKYPFHVIKNDYGFYERSRHPLRTSFCKRILRMLSIPCARHFAIVQLHLCCVATKKVKTAAENKPHRMYFQ
jgi:hypothetical protein